MGNKLFYRIRLPALLLVLAGTYSGLTTTHAQTIRPGTQKELKIFDPTSNASGNIGLRAAAGTSSYTLTLPSSLPTANQVLGVNGISGDVATLTWTTVSVTAVSTFSGGTTGLTPNTGTSGAVTLAGTLGVANGGTGAITLSGMLKGNGTSAITGITGTTGGVTFWTDANTISSSLAGTTGRALVSGGTGAPTWFAPTPGSILFASTSGILAEDNAGLFYDMTNDRLGIGDNTPLATLTVGANDAFQVNSTGAIAAATGVTTSGGILINPTAGVAGQLRLRNPANTFQTNIQAGAQTADITYILPTIAPTAGQFLSSSDANGNLSWTSGSAGWGLSGNAITASTAALGVAPTGGSWLGTTNSQSLVFGTNNVTRVIIASDGSVTSNGNITAPAFFETSDQRLKNIVKRDGDVVYFKWKDGRDSKTHIGYLAQEVQQKMPDQVKADEKGMLSVNYIEILVAKIRELEKRIHELEKNTTYENK